MRLHDGEPHLRRGAVLHLSTERCYAETQASLKTFRVKQQGI